MAQRIVQTDVELVALAQAGVEQAYVELCDRYRGMAFFVINRILKNREDAEDALQETLLKVYLHLGGFDGRAKFSTWLTRIAINAALMSLRKRVAHPMQSLDELQADDTPRFIEPVCPLPDPERSLAERQRYVHLKQAIRHLPRTLRGVTELRQSDDLTISEVAAMAGLSLSATKSRLLRARIELSTILCQPGSGRVRMDARGQ
ncbi:RNA polymerase, sigma subunit, ECF family [Granulicella rosea]|uniref:RNA polymerase, sigma subunit, ECF family n=1 Tax=Granulicella rosea TaxID=474952 RepID=A0A239JPN8_9BACT|nr:sigma-70 family RNA polymerase sigma factor [Granulicella rosea]SNT07986.1 RNA polymerase, sigma subunit, ECF family [Granulicella rosea]